MNFRTKQGYGKEISLWKMPSPEGGKLWPSEMSDSSSEAYIKDLRLETVISCFLQQFNILNIDKKILMLIFATENLFY